METTTILATPDFDSDGGSLDRRMEMLPEVTTSDFTVLVFGEITSESAKRFCRQLLDCNLIDPYRPIKILINSPGGDVSSLWAMLGVMQSISNPKITYAFGEAASCAFSLLIAGDLRYCYENSLLMEHEAWTRLEGTFTQLISEQKMIGITYEQFRKHYELCTGLSASILEKTLLSIGQNVYLDPKEALELNCVDIIIKSLPRGKKEYFMNLPEELLGDPSIIVRRPAPKKTTRGKKNAK